MGVGGGVVEGSDGAAVLGGTGAGGPPVIHALGGPHLCVESSHVGDSVVSQHIAHLLARPADVLLALQPVIVLHRLRAHGNPGSHHHLSCLSACCWFTGNTKILATRAQGRTQLGGHYDDEVACMQSA